MVTWSSRQDHDRLGFRRGLLRLIQAFIGAVKVLQIVPKGGYDFRFISVL